MEFILFLAAIILCYILFPIFLCYVILKSIFKWDIRILKIWFYRTSYSVDQTGNVIGNNLMNDILIKKGGYQFGNPDETISSVIGKNYRDDTLTVLGKSIRFILDSLDYNHCLNSIDNEETNTRK